MWRLESRKLIRLKLEFNGLIDFLIIAQRQQMVQIAIRPKQIKSKRQSKA